MNLYFDERQKRKYRRILKLKIYGSLFLFLALVIGAGYLIVYSPLFRIKQININVEAGADEHGFKTTINTDQLTQNLKDFFTHQSKITKFLAANNILIWDSKKLTEFPKNPEIAEISMEKDYIEREIKINVKQREKFGVWCQQKESTVNSQESIVSDCYWFDKNGIIFSSAPMIEGNLINKVDDFSGRFLKLGNKVIDERLFLNLIKIFDILEKSNLGIKSLKLERLELQEIETESLPKIYFSLRNDPGFTLAALESLKNIGLEKIEYIDLRVENRAYYKLKNSL